MTELTADVALLTPVPYEHLVSGQETCSRTGFVAYGTDAVMVMSELKSLVDADHPAGVLIYASHTTDGGPPRATFRARFVSFDGAIGGRAKPAWAGYRPKTTATDGNWTSFYLISELHELERPLPIGALQKRGNKGKFSKTFVPQGPIIIDTPF